MKKLFSLMLVLIVALSMVISVSAAEPNYVYDEAQVLSQAQETELSAMLEKLSSTYNRQIIAVTIAEVSGGDLDAATEDMYERIHAGHGADADGMMLLLSQSTQKARIYATGDCKRIVNDTVSRRILRAMEDALEDGDYAEAIDDFADKSEDYLSGKAYRFPYIIAVLTALAAAYLTGMLVGKKLKAQLKTVHGGYYAQSEQLELTDSTDAFLCKKTEKTRKPKEEPKQSTGSKK